MTDADDQLDQQLDEADVNRIDAPDASASGDGDEPAPTAISVLDLIVTSLVDDADAVRIDAIEQRDRVRLEVRVGPDEMGRVIGKRGRVANAIRTVVRAAAVRDDVAVDIEFED
ncbi:MAG: KH domain-containing protein [Actinomycetota bacterium]